MNTKAESSANRKLNRRDPMVVVVTSHGERIGTMTCDEFMAAHPAPHGTFLQANVEAFNAWKQRTGESERVHVELRKGARRG
jgi:hypothetical protein